MKFHYNGTEVEIIDWKEPKIKYTSTGRKVKSETKKQAMIKRGKQIKEQKKVKKITQKEWKAKKRHGYTLTTAEGQKKILVNSPEGTTLKKVEIV